MSYIKNNITYTNTYNSFIKFYPEQINQNIERKNQEFLEFICKAYTSPTTTKEIKFTTNFGFTEEILEYDLSTFCFIGNEIYKVLFNYFPDKKPNELSNENIHVIRSNEILDDFSIMLKSDKSKINYSIINTYDAFVNFCNENNRIMTRNTRPLIATCFKKALKENNFNYSNCTDFSEGYYAANDKHVFYYIHFSNIIIITNYKVNTMTVTVIEKD